MSSIDYKRMGLTPITVARLRAEEAPWMSDEYFNRWLMTESGYNPSARSSAGAIGVGQLMPDTAKEMGVNPYDTEDNLRGSLRYMNKSYAEHHGDLYDTARGYFGGIKGKGTKWWGEKTDKYGTDVSGLYGTGTTPREAGAMTRTGAENGEEPRDEDFDPSGYTVTKGDANGQEPSLIGSALGGLAQADTRGLYGAGWGALGGGLAAGVQNYHEAMAKMRADKASANVWASAGEGILYNKNTGEYKYPDGAGESMPEWRLPIYKTAKEQFEQADKIGGAYRKSIGNFEESARHFRTVGEMIKQNPDFESWTNADAIVLVKALEKTIDPTSVVRGSEAEAYADGAAKLDQAKKLLTQALKGGAKLTGTEIKNIIRALNNAYSASLPQAKTVREGYRKRGENRGVIQYDEDRNVTRNDAFTIYDWDEPWDNDLFIIAGDDGVIDLPPR